MIREVTSDGFCAQWFAAKFEILPREFPSGLNCFAAAGGEEHAVEIARCEVGEARCEFNRVWMGVGPDGEVLKRGGLLGRSFTKFAAAMTNLHSEQTGEPVEVTLSFYVPHPAAVAAFDNGCTAVTGAESTEVSP